MKKTNDKLKQYSFIAVLLVICIVLVGLIYSSSPGREGKQQVVEPVDVNDHVEVDELEATSNLSEEVQVELDDLIIVEPVNIDSSDKKDDTDVLVEQIVVDENVDTEISVYEVEEINVPVAEEPEKPDTIPPEETPETTDDLTDPDKVPEYDEEETTYVAEPVIEEQENEVRDSNLVPDAENPFLQDDIPSNGDMGEMMGEDYYEDGVKAGEGDKF